MSSVPDPARATVAAPRLDHFQKGIQTAGPCYYVGFASVRVGEGYYWPGERKKGREGGEKVTPRAVVPGNVVHLEVTNIG